MLKIRCPSCGTNLYEGYFTFPRCHKCNANALCCRACVSYDPSRGVCVDPTSPIDTVTDPDELPQCGIFRPTMPVADGADRPLGRRFWTYVAAGVAAVAIIFSIVLVGVRARGRPAGLVATISKPAEVFTDRPAPVGVAVTNSDATAAREISIRLPSDTLDRWDIEPGSPAPLRDEMRGSTRYLVYEAPAGGQAQITVNLRPHRIGQSQFRIEVTDHRGRMLALLNERLDVTP